MQKRDPRILFLIKALIAMIFVSKISLGAFLPLPQSWSYFVFQKGLHPYLNIFFCFILGLPLAVFFLQVKDRSPLSGFYKLFILSLVMVLSFQTTLQITLVEESALIAGGALGSALFMVAIYGWIIPSLWTPREFLIFLQRWAGILVVISVILWPFFGGAFFKGGRFIGVFKHIPHMVTCATVAFIFSLGTFLQAQRLSEKFWNILVLVTSLVAIVLTGTRSSLVAALFALILVLVLHKTQSNVGRLLKFSGIIFFTLYSLFFGMQTLEFAGEIATGQASLGARQAQDGVSSRWEEIERGYQIFVQRPWVGHGLMSKFSSGGDVDLSGYNSMKDPHNMFISAGVIGGWPLLILSLIGLVFMLIGALKSLKSSELSKRQLAIYLVSHIPILAIYHVHLSLGGMADRIYWLVFGFVAVAVSMKTQGEQVPSSKRRPKVAL